MKCGSAATGDLFSGFHSFHFFVIFVFCIMSYQVDTWYKQNIDFSTSAHRRILLLTSAFLWNSSISQSSSIPINVVNFVLNGPWGNVAYSSNHILKIKPFGCASKMQARKYNRSNGLLHFVIFRLCFDILIIKIISV